MSAGKLNRQLVFDTGYKRILAQGGRSLNLKGQRAYRAENGRACVIGACIPDEVYDPAIEDATPGQVSTLFEFVDRFPHVVKLAEVLDRCPVLEGWRDDARWLNGFQKAHDNYDTPADKDTLDAVQLRLAKFALTHNLTIPE